MKPDKYVPFSNESGKAWMAATDAKWAEKTKRYVKAEIVRAGISHAELAARLSAMGLPETDTGITAKLNRGTFPAWFMLAVMEALGCTSIRLGD